MNKLGVIIGKLSKIGVNATIFPGVKIGKQSWIGPGEVVKYDVDDKTYLNNGEEKDKFKNMKKITVIGGGTGTFVVLSGLKNFQLDLSVVVSMMDSGGSTGRLRDQLGILPPGDLRQCLVALSDAPILWRKLFLYRFEKGDLKGHNFGNIFLAALEKVSRSYDEAIETVAYVLKTKGKVIPVTLNKLHLVAEYENGKKLLVKV